MRPQLFMIGLLPAVPAVAKTTKSPDRELPHISYKLAILTLISNPLRSQPITLR